MHGPIVAGADALHKTVKLAKAARTSVTIPITAAGLGIATLDVRLTGPGIDASQTFRLKVQPGTSELYHRTVRNIAPGASMTISSDLLAEFLPGTGAISTAVSPYGAIDVPALLLALDRYPHGCSEQTVSRAMPLLYVNKLAAMEQLALDDKADARIKAAIETVMSRQDSNGAFGLWTAGGSDDIWLDAYVMDFLTRSREKNFAVPQKGFDQALDRLRNYVVNVSELDEAKASELAYAVYVLARNGRPVMSDLRYLADTKLKVFASPMARAQLAASFALLGDKGRATQVFASALDRLKEIKDDKYSRPDYGSRLRDGAGTLALLAESGQSGGELTRASVVVEDARNIARYTSTQEEAWMVIAAQALAGQTEALSLTVNGEAKKGAYYRTFREAALEAKPVTIVNNSTTAPARVVLTTSGHPGTPEPAATQGYEVERSFYRLDGKKLDTVSVKQNDRLVVVLKITEKEANYARLILVDHLAAGLEIDNPNLVDSGTVAGLDWLKKDLEASHTEYKDDRFVASFDRDSGQAATFNVAYIVRAVAPGHYVLPPATVEDMYRPERFGRTAYGVVDVAGK